MFTTGLRFLILKHNFEIFSTISIFLINFVIWVWTFPYLAPNVRHNRQKCILHVQTNIRWKIGFRIESVTLFNSIRTLHKNLPDCLLGKFGTFVRASFLLYGGSFWENNNCFKKICFFLSLWDLEWRGKKLTFDNFLSALLSKLYSESPVQQFDFFEHFLSSYFFEIRARIVETCCAKNLARVLKLHSTSIDKQSEEKPNFRTNIVLHTFLWLGGEKTWLVTTLFLHCCQDCVFGSGAEFWDLIPTILKFLIFSATEYELFPYLAENFKRSCQKCTLRVRTNIW